MAPINILHRPIAIAVVLAAVAASVALVLVSGPTAPPAAAAVPPRVRDYHLNVMASDVDMGNAAWHAWTFNGTVPGPTLSAVVGDVIRVTVHNSMDVVHSFHTHLSPYSLPNDGAQLNLISGIGRMAMIPPGESYTYEFEALVPGLYYYHCHSADGGHTIQQHIAQGLYGAIIIESPEEPAVRDEVLFMAERGFDAPGDAPFYIMNGHGLPGGEHALETIFVEHGIEGVKSALATGVVPIIAAKVGETLRLNVVNIGDQIHSFHLHAMTAYSVDMHEGRPLPAQVSGLVPGEVDRLLVTPSQPGLWLFHCHVVSHADAGMIGVLVVNPASGPPVLDMTGVKPGIPKTTAHAAPSHPTGATPAAGAIAIEASRPSAEFAFFPSEVKVGAPGTFEVAFNNTGKIVHTVTFTGVVGDTGNVNPGAAATIRVTFDKAGEYEFVCTVPGHKESGMRGKVVVG